MVRSATNAYRVFVERAKSGHRLARVANDRFGSLNSLHETMRHRRHAGKMLKKIENRPLGSQERSHGTANAEKRRGFLIAESAFDQFEMESRNEFDAQAFVERAADVFNDRQSTRDARRFLKERTDADGAFVDQQFRSDIPRAEILAQREFDEWFEIGERGEFWHLVEL